MKFNSQKFQFLLTFLFVGNQRINITFSFLTGMLREAEEEINKKIKVTIKLYNV